MSNSNYLPCICRQLRRWPPGRQSFPWLWGPPVSRTWRGRERRGRSRRAVPRQSRRLRPSKSLRWSRCTSSGWAGSGWRRLLKPFCLIAARSQQGSSERESAPYWSLLMSIVNWCHHHSRYLMTRREQGGNSHFATLATYCCWAEKFSLIFGPVNTVAPYLSSHANTGNIVHNSTKGFRLDLKQIQKHSGWIY